MSLTPSENNLLLYLECCAVDYGGKIAHARMNDADMEIMKSWSDSGFIRSGRILSEHISGLNAHWITLSPDAWSAAHNERKARAVRMLERTSKQFNGFTDK